MHKDPFFSEHSMINVEHARTPLLPEQVIANEGVLSERVIIKEGNAQRRLLPEDVIANEGNAQRPL